MVQTRTFTITSSNICQQTAATTRETAGIPRTTETAIRAPPRMARCDRDSNSNENQHMAANKELPRTAKNHQQSTTKKHNKTHNNKDLGKDRREALIPYCKIESNKRKRERERRQGFHVVRSWRPTSTGGKPLTATSLLYSQLCYNIPNVGFIY
jgi:hypothetical protein